MPNPNCEECRGTGWYVGLDHRERCSTCFPKTPEVSPTVASDPPWEALRAGCNNMADAMRKFNRAVRDFGRTVGDLWNNDLHRIMKARCREQKRYFGTATITPLGYAAPNHNLLTAFLEAAERQEEPLPLPHTRTFKEQSYPRFVMPVVLWSEEGPVGTLWSFGRGSCRTLVDLNLTAPGDLKVDMDLEHSRPFPKYAFHLLPSSKLVDLVETDYEKAIRVVAKAQAVYAAYAKHLNIPKGDFLPRRNPQNARHSVVQRISFWVS